MDKKNVTEKIVLRNVKLVYRNFSGNASKFNRAGSRNFAVVFHDKEEAEKYAQKGWNVRSREARNEDEEPMYYLSVQVNLESFNPPHIYMGPDKKNMITVDEKNISELDHADILGCDIQIRPYNWEVNGSSGVKAYLQTLYVYIEEDPFADDYAEEEFPGEDPEDLPF